MWPVLLPSWHTQPNYLLGTWSRPAFPCSSRSSHACIWAGELSLLLELLSDLSCLLSSNNERLFLESQEFAAWRFMSQAVVSTTFRWVEDQCPSQVWQTLQYCIADHMWPNIPQTQTWPVRQFYVAPWHAGWSTSLVGTEIHIDLMSLPFSSREPYSFRCIGLASNHMTENKNVFLPWK